MKLFYSIIIIILIFFSACKKDNLTPEKPAEETRITHAELQLIPYDVKGVSRVTGKTLPNDGYLNPNQTDVKYDVGGTDLGIMWDLGNGRTGIFFGDTFGKDWVYTNAGGANGSNWRSNVAAYSSDNYLDDGLTFSGMLTDANGAAKEIIPSPHNTSGNGSFTSIPTAAVRINDVDYIHYMDIKQWGDPGKWTTNASYIYYSSNNGQTSAKADNISFSSTSNFAQAAYAKKDGYVYMMGTQSGRFGAAYLARFLEADILNQAEYEYWAGSASGWVKNDEQAAVPIFDGPVSEISLVYNTHFNRWIVTYLHSDKLNIVMRDAADITGTWSNTKNLVTWNKAPGLYGAFIHPQKNNSDELYFLMSVWGPYNVFLVKAKLKMQ